MPGPLQAIQGLGPLRWRGSEHYDFADAGFSFQLRQNRLTYPYIDYAGHEHTGIDKELPITLFFLNSIRENAFPQLWNEWKVILLDGKPGPMEHPLAGVFDAVVTSGQVDLNARATSGVTAQINFERHIDDPEEEQKIDLLGLDLEAAAVAADAASGAVNISLPSQAPVTSLLDAAKLIQSALLTAQLRAEGLINQAKAFVDEMIQLARAADDPLYYAVNDTLITFWTALDDTASNLGALARETGFAIVPNPTTIDAFARDRGMTLPEALALNPSAIGAPGIPAGTLLKYYV
jgi:hypothetical protein